MPLVFPFRSTDPLPMIFRFYRVWHARIQANAVGIEGVFLVGKAEVCAWKN
jgi:hypothetical protein